MRIYYRIEELKWAINKLMETARRLKEKRTRSGAVELEGVEVQVQLTDNKSTIDDLIPKQVLHLLHTFATLTWKQKFISIVITNYDSELRLKIVAT